MSANNKPSGLSYADSTKKASTSPLDGPAPAKVFAPTGAWGKNVRNPGNQVASTVAPSPSDAPAFPSADASVPSSTPAVMHETETQNRPYGGYKKHGYYNNNNNNQGRNPRNYNPNNRYHQQNSQHVSHANPYAGNAPVQPVPTRLAELQGPSYGPFPRVQSAPPAVKPQAPTEESAVSVGNDTSAVNQSSGVKSISELNPVASATGEVVSVSQESSSETLASASNGQVSHTQGQPHSESHGHQQRYGQGHQSQHYGRNQHYQGGYQSYNNPRPRHNNYNKGYRSQSGQGQHYPQGPAQYHPGFGMGTHTHMGQPSQMAHMAHAQGNYFSVGYPGQYENAQLYYPAGTPFPPPYPVPSEAGAPWMATPYGYGAVAPGQAAVRPVYQPVSMGGPVPVQGQMVPPPQGAPVPPAGSASPHVATSVPAPTVPQGQTSVPASVPQPFVPSHSASSSQIGTAPSVPAQPVVTPRKSVAIKITNPKTGMDVDLKSLSLQNATPSKSDVSDKPEAIAKDTATSATVSADTSSSKPEVAEATPVPSMIDSSPQKKPARPILKDPTTGKVIDLPSVPSEKKIDQHTVEEKDKADIKPDGEAQAEVQIKPSDSVESVVVSSDDLVQEPESADANDAELEDGEIVEEEPSAPVERVPARFLTKDDKISYPDSVPQHSSGSSKYSLAFLLSFKPLSDKFAPPEGMPSQTDLFGEVRSSGRNSVSNSFAGSNRGGRGSYTQHGKGQMVSVGPSYGGRSSQYGSGFHGHGGVNMSRKSSSGGHNKSHRQGSYSGKGRSSYHESSPSTPSLPAVEPLRPSANAWGPRSKANLSPEEVALRAVQAILNKLTLENFQKLALQMVQETSISNEAILGGVIDMIFTKAIQEKTFGRMYADLCVFLTHHLPEYQSWMSKDVKDSEFRRGLLRKCQTLFESDANWTNLSEEQLAERRQYTLDATSFEGENRLRIEREIEETQNLKRRFLGNVRFSGELYVAGMISERIIHSLFIKLLKSVTNIDEQDVETCCKLMTTVGKKLDTPNNKAHIDSYLTRLSELSKHVTDSRIRFMCLDVIDLRKDNWVLRGALASEGPKKLSELQEEARKAAELKQLEMERKSSKASSKYGGGHYKSGGGSVGMKRQASKGSHGQDARYSGRRDDDKLGKISFGGNKNQAATSSSGGWGFVPSKGSSSSSTPPRNSTETSPTSSRDALQINNSFALLGAEEHHQSSEGEAETDKPRSPSSAQKVMSEKEQEEVLKNIVEKIKSKDESLNVLTETQGIYDRPSIKSFVIDLLDYIIETDAQVAEDVSGYLKDVFVGGSRVKPVFDLDDFFSGLKMCIYQHADDEADVIEVWSAIGRMLGILLGDTLVTAKQLNEVITHLHQFKARQPLAPRVIGCALKVIDLPQKVLIPFSEGGLAKYWPEDACHMGAVNRWISTYSLDELKWVLHIIPLIREQYSLDQFEPCAEFRFLLKSMDTEAKVLSQPDFLKTLVHKTLEYAYTESKKVSDPKEEYSVCKNMLTVLAPILSYHVAKDTIDTQTGLSIWLAVEDFAKAKDNAEFLTHVARILYNCDLISADVFYEYQKSTKGSKDTFRKTAFKHLEGWYAYLEQEKAADE